MFFIPCSLLTTATIIWPYVRQKHTITSLGYTSNLDRVKPFNFNKFEGQKMHLKLVGVSQTGKSSVRSLIDTNTLRDKVRAWRNPK